MKVTRGIGWVLLGVVPLIAGGCFHGPGFELGGYASSVDSRDLGDGYGGGAKLEFNPIDWVSIDGRAGWVRFDDKGVDMVPLEAAGLLNFPAFGERFVPYVGAGVGYYLFRADDANLDDNVGFFPLVGLEVGLYRISFLAEARWLFLQTDVDQARGELRNLTEADVDGLGINLGAILRF